MKIFNFIILVLLAFSIYGCKQDNRKCLKSHMESTCACMCSNNIGIPIMNEYEHCDLYEEKAGNDTNTLI